MLNPSQRRAVDDVVAAVRAGAQVVELRTGKVRSRGHGITTCMNAIANELGCQSLGVRNALEADAQPAARLFEAATKELATHGVTVIDDLDLAVAPRSLARSRTLVETLKGTSSVYQWGADPTVPRVLKALLDTSAAAAICNGEKPHCIVFSSVEDTHEPFLQAPLVVSLDAPTTDDYESVITAAGGEAIDASAVFALHAELSAAELRAAVVRAATASKAKPTSS